MATNSKQAQPTGKETDLFYEDRFWEQYVGKNLVSDPVTAIVELVANCWDAGATRVEVTWPDQEAKTLRVGDNGEGMTRNEFYRRWGGMSYDRIRHQGSTVEVLVGDSVRTRKVFGRNGIGRFAGFCFAAQYTVTTTKGGKRHQFLVRKGRKQPLEFQTLGSTDAGGKDIRGSGNRPDFAILPDSTVGFYTYPEYDDQGGEVGPAKVVVVELKAPDVPVGDEEKGQCWKYVRELYAKGMITERTRVQGFVLGRTIRQVDREERTEMNGRVRILPLDFEWVLQRADSRLLKLREKIKNAPFLREAGLDKFCAEPDLLEGELPLGDHEVAA